jgi:hypothetical protein
MGPEGGEQTDGVECAGAEQRGEDLEVGVRLAKGFDLGIELSNRANHHAHFGDKRFDLYH